MITHVEPGNLQPCGDVRHAPATLVARPDTQDAVAERNRRLERQNRELKLTVQRLSKLVYVDGLTGLANRRYLDSALEAELRRVSRTRTRVTLMFCDIDHFKRINDDFGHQCGDAVLRKVGETISRHCRRAGDVAARYGGDEFALLLPSVDSAETIAIAERLRRSVAAISIPRRAAYEGEHVTISIGVTTFRSTVLCPPSAVVRAADTALYRAKQAGRDRTKYQAIELARNGRGGIPSSESR
jgi:diguanylate cyclase